MAKYPIRTITQVMSSVNSIFLRTSLSVPLESCAPIQALASVLHGQLPSWGHATNSFHASLSWYVSLMKYSQFSHSVVSDSLWRHGLQHARLPCPSPSPRTCSNSCPSSQWWHPTISSSVIPFSSDPQSFPASGSFQMSQLFASGGQSIRVSASTLVLPMNIQDWFPLGWTGWISLQSKGLWRVFSNTTV